MSVNWDELRKEMNRLDYPENQYFDPEIIPNQYLTNNNDRMRTIYAILFNIVFKYDVLDVGCNRGLFSFAFHHIFNRIVAIDPLSEYIALANKIKDAHGIKNINFVVSSFEKWLGTSTYDMVHFGQCNQYLFRDGFRRKEDPLWFLTKAKKLANKYIAIDGGYDGDPSVEFDAKQDKWPPNVKRMATIEFYAFRLRPEFKLIKYGWSGDGATRYMAIFERI
jgi:SAM-dependent methyltransferase